MNKRRIFSEEFKRGAVDMVLQEGMTHTEVCKHLDIGHSTLWSWIRRFKEPEESKGVSVEELTKRVKKLESENRILRMEREILKKATVNSTGHCNIP